MKTIVCNPGQSIPVIGSDTTLCLMPGRYVLPGPIRASGQNIVIQPASANAPAPRIEVAGNGLAVGTVNRLRVKGLDFISLKTTAEGTNGVTLNGKSSNDIQFEDMLWQGFGYNAVIQHPKAESAPRSEYLKNIAFRRCRFLDARLTWKYSGQSIYAGQFDGLLVEECIADCAGWDGKSDNARIYSHNFYGNVTGRNFTARNSFWGRGSMYGLQCRGDGTILDGNLCYECATGILVNGNKATVTRNVIVAGHWIAATKDNPGFGAGGIEWAAASGSCDGNTYIHTGAPPRPKMTVAPPWWLSNRSEAWSTEKPGWTLGRNTALPRGPKLSAVEIDSARSGRTSAVQLMASVKGQM